MKEIVCSKCGGDGGPGGLWTEFEPYTCNSKRWCEDERKGVPHPVLTESPPVPTAEATPEKAINPDSPFGRIKALQPPESAPIEIVLLHNNNDAYLAGYAQALKDVKSILKGKK
jgi:hypothetical protein